MVWFEMKHDFGATPSAVLLVSLSLGRFLLTLLWAVRRLPSLQ